MKKSSRTITVVLAIICVLLTATLVIIIIDNNSTVEALKLNIENLENQIEENKEEISSLNLQITNKNSQIQNITYQKDQTQNWLNNNITTFTNQIQALQTQISTNQATINEYQTQLTTSNNQINLLMDEKTELENQNQTNQILINDLKSNITTNQQTINTLQNQLNSSDHQIDSLTIEKTGLENQINKFEEVLIFNTSKLETLVFHICEKNWTNIPDINSTYNQILALNNNTYEILILPEYEQHQNWTAELDWLNNNFMGNQGIPIMLQTFSGSEPNLPITKLSPENITTALTTCNIKYLRFAEVISWHKEHNIPFPTTYVKTILDYCRTNGLKIFWTEWKTDHPPESEVFTLIQSLIEGYEDIVTVSFSTNSGEEEPSIEFLNLDNMFQNWGASIQPWYWDTRYEEDLQNMPIPLLVQHALAAKNIGAKILQFEPYWYFFNFENGETTEKLEVLFTMLK